MEEDTMELPPRSLCCVDPKADAAEQTVRALSYSGGFIVAKENRKFNTVEEAIEELQAGHIIIVTDDPDRENEGDFICAAQYCTTENMNFMATHGKGLICMPMSIEYARKLGLRRW